METQITKRSNRWLYVLAGVYLLFFFIFAPHGSRSAPIRWGGFFLLTQILIQVIFPQFRCTRIANFIVASLLISGTIFLITQS